MNTIFTISRQSGSGGRRIGMALARELEIPFFDRESLRRTVQEDMRLEDLLTEAYGQKSASSILYNLAINSHSFGYPNSGNNGLFSLKTETVAFDAVRRVAGQGPCVIVGRCADYALRKDERLFSVFFHAPFPVRAERVSDRWKIGLEAAGESILETDRLRRNYYNYYTNKNWGETGSYHLSLDTSAMKPQEMVDLLVQINNNRKDIEKTDVDVVPPRHLSYPITAGVRCDSRIG